MGLFEKIGSKRQIAACRERLFRMALAWCGDRATADDLTQECLAKALHSCDQLKDWARLECWLFRILNNCWNTHLRQRRPSGSVEEAPGECTECAETTAYRSEVVVKVRAAVASLPAPQRQVVTLVDLEGFGYAEVAVILEVPLGTVMSRLNRARRQLHADLERIFEPDRSRPYLWRAK